MNFKGLFAAIAALAMGAGAADAATYTFDVTYTGGGSASLAAGSDDMLAVAPVNGDVINYTITASPSGAYWTTLQDGSSLLISGAIGDLLGAANGGFDYSAAFVLGGVTQYGESGSAAQCCVDLGPRSLDFPSGMSFDTFSETLTLTSVPGPVTFYSILPSWPGEAPEIAAPDVFAFSSPAAAPEPATWGMMLLGVGGAGAMLRRRRPAATA